MSYDYTEFFALSVKMALPCNKIKESVETYGQSLREFSPMVSRAIDDLASLVDIFDPIKSPQRESIKSYLQEFRQYQEFSVLSAKTIYTLGTLAGITETICRRRYQQYRELAILPEEYGHLSLSVSISLGKVIKKVSYPRYLQVQLSILSRGHRQPSVRVTRALSELTPRALVDDNEMGRFENFWSLLSVRALWSPAPDLSTKQQIFAPTKSVALPIPSKGGTSTLPETQNHPKSKLYRFGAAKDLLQIHTS